MTKTTNPLTLAITEVLQPMGFERKGNSWYHTTSEVIQVVNLQKSQYGAQYYVNCALWLRVIEEKTYPREEQCHIRQRLRSLTVDKIYTDQLLDLDYPILGDRKTLFTSLLAKDLAPFIKRSGSVLGVKELYTSNTLANAMIHGTALGYLEMA